MAIEQNGRHSHQEDRELVQCCLLGETSCFAELVRRHQQVVRTLIWRKVHDMEMVDELAHQTFISAYEHLADYAGESKLSTWMCQIALNKARDHLRWHARQKVTCDISELDLPSGEPDPAMAVDREDRKRLLNRALAKLSQDDKDVLVFKYMLEYDYKTIGEMLSCTASAAKVRGFRARAVLRSFL